MSGGNTVNLTPLKNDADSDPANEIQDLSLTGNTLKITNNTSATNINLGTYLDNTDSQTLTYNPATYNLSVSGGNSVSLGAMVAFRAGIGTSFDLPNNTPTSLVFNQVTGGNLYNDGGYNSSNGVFKAPVAGIYSFGVSLNLMASSSSIILYLDGAPYETIIGPTASAGQFRGTIVLKLNEDSEVNLYITQTNGFPIPAYSISGTFSGFRVY
jgi:hypothetical protein